MTPSHTWLDDCRRTLGPSQLAVVRFSRFSMLSNRMMKEKNDGGRFSRSNVALSRKFLGI